MSHQAQLSPAASHCPTAVLGPPAELPRIKNRAAYEKGQTAPPDWRIACCYAGKGHRRQGVAAAVLDLIAAFGGETVEGYPENAGSVPAGFLYNGALSTFEKLGFTRDRKMGKHRWVVTTLVEAGHRGRLHGPGTGCRMAPGTAHAEGSLVLGDPRVRRIADIGLATFRDADLPEARERQRRPVDDAVSGSPAAGFRLKTDCLCCQMLHSA